MPQGPESRPTVDDFRQDNQWVSLAKSLWPETSKKSRRSKIKHDTVKKDLWDPLEADGFSLRSLLTLENLNVLEKYGLFRDRQVSFLSNGLIGSFGQRTRRTLPTTMFC